MQTMRDIEREMLERLAAFNDAFRKVQTVLAEPHTEQEIADAKISNALCYLWFSNRRVPLEYDHDKKEWVIMKTPE
jgi:hypothetical protein